MKLSYPPSGPIKNSPGYAVAAVPNIKNYHLREVKEQKAHRNTGGSTLSFTYAY